MTDVHGRIREFWDRDAEGYDRIASHAASEPVIAAAWREAIRRSLPPSGASVLDVGAGTGAMSLLAAELGHKVTALDLSRAMLERARRKAEVRGLDVTFVVGPATDPPDGPFEAVMERHLIWTAPDPVAALRAWRKVAPSGRLVLFEGLWGSTSPAYRARQLAAEWLRKAMGVPPDHHAPYDPEVLAELPLARLPSPLPLIRAVQDAGWRAPRIHRLRDVEWAHRLASPAPLGWLEHVVRYALLAES